MWVAGAGVQRSEKATGRSVSKLPGLGDEGLAVGVAVGGFAGGG
jgi:hypothetical protein